jgi:hypothetical protein
MREAEEFKEAGFVIGRSLLNENRIADISVAYDAAFAAAGEEVVKGSTSLRRSELAHRDRVLTDLVADAKLLALCSAILRNPPRLRFLNGRTVEPFAAPQKLHVDLKAVLGETAFLGFIVMLDDFHADNGATRFVPGSHHWPGVPGDVMIDPSGDHPAQTITTGKAGDIIIYDSAVWHGHSANRTARSRRSIQGGFES